MNPAQKQFFLNRGASKKQIPISNSLTSGPIGTNSGEYNSNHPNISHRTNNCIWSD